MKVLMQNRADLFDKPGGDLVQMQKTKKALEELGVTVDISTGLQADLSGYDVVHLFNITRIHESLAQLRHAKKSGRPVVLSPIYHKVSEIERYEKLGRTGALRHLNSVFRTTAGRETLKNVARMRDSRQRPAIASTLRQGFYQVQREVLDRADGWLVLAELEASAIKEDFAVEKPWAVAPNGIDPQFFGARPDAFVGKFGLQDFVLCVSRIEDRKNQIRLINAMKGLGQQLVFIGGMNLNHRAYVAEFKKLVEANKNWVHYLGPVAYEDLPSAYAAAKVHALPSWFEVVSLTALEAAAAGCCGAVTSAGYMREFLADEVAYCDPASVESITASVQCALAAGDEPSLAEKMKKLTWANTARQTLLAYESVIH